MSSNIGIKISQLPPFLGSPGPTGDVPISIAGVTYRIDPSKLNPAGAGTGSMNRLDEFEVKAGGTMEPTDTVYTNVLLAAVRGVIVLIGGTLIPSIVLTVGGRRIGFTPGDDHFTIYGAVSDTEHVLILTY